MVKGCVRPFAVCCLRASVSRVIPRRASPRRVVRLLSGTPERAIAWPTTGRALPMWASLRRLAGGLALPAVRSVPVTSFLPSLARGLATQKKWPKSIRIKPPREERNSQHKTVRGRKMVQAKPYQGLLGLKQIMFGNNVSFAHNTCAYSHAARPLCKMLLCHPCKRRC